MGEKRATSLQSGAADATWASDRGAVAFLLYFHRIVCQVH
jgi:hypothetical protein